MADNEIAAFQGQDAAAIKKSAGAARTELARTMASMEAQAAELKADLERRRAQLEADFARERSALLAQMEPIRQQLARMQEVMWTVDLYLGRDETLELLRDGEPAPADTPITIRQKVLVMAEEALLLMDRGATGITHTSIPVFIDWLLQAPENLSRILPEQRGVVVLIPTRVKSRSGNAFEDSARDKANSSSWWLLRNGQRLYLLTVDPELQMTERVLPRRDEFVDVFDRSLFGFGRPRGEPVKPGSAEWLEMEKIADARRRHYMRILLVLQGIIDRTPVWQPLPAAGVNLMSLADQDNGKIVLLQDDELSIQLGDGRESFRDWQIRLNGQLRPGLRIIGDWNTRDFRDIGSTPWRNPRLRPRGVNCEPAANEPHLIEERRDGGFVIRFQRTDKVYKRNVPVPDEPSWVYRHEYPVTPSRRASCLVMPEDTWVLPLDLVSREELTYYLTSRDNRSAQFLSMVPTIRAALAVKDVEAQQEAPFRTLIADQLINDGADPDTIEALVEELVHWWKIANTWSRPLNGEPAHEAKAIRAILTEHRARTKHLQDGTAETVLRAGRKIPGVIAVARNRQGAWHAYTPSAPAHDPGVYLDITPIHADSALGAVKTFQILARRSASLLHVAWSTPQWDTWKFSANPRWYLTTAERDQLVEEVLQDTAGLPLCVTEIHDPGQPEVRLLISYSWTGGTPEQAPVRSTRTPLDWHHEERDNPLVTSRVFLVDKTPNQLGLKDPDDDWHTDHPRHFQHFSIKSRWGEIPWWPENAHRYADAQGRPRLIWSDETMLDRLAAYTARCTEAYQHDQDIEQQRRDRITSFVAPTRAAVLAAAEHKAKARFLEDYGPGALDLWPAHLKSLKLATPVSRDTIWDLVSAAINKDVDPAGRALTSLTELFTGSRRARLEEALGDFGHITVQTTAK
ncbi:Uncharacterised protein [Mycobacteroides abscessus subsp. abscessus]|uniref:hypothetical protein n=1 Tax=Mycobacteroides abscessus TaxID=36809 RepID=UPI00092B80FD|nr:hypothetical protein [Mycobacteroides abscessus]SHU65462.1 Uncharacterised protein [Mycobacteroides abscessus subsp. abscessus]